jgi:hypothetical protein
MPDERNHCWSCKHYSESEKSYRLWCSAPLPYWLGRPAGALHSMDAREIREMTSCPTFVPMEPKPPRSPADERP